MKAIVYREYGSPDVLHLEELDKPRPKDNEVLIKVHAAEVTKGDCEMRSFQFAVRWFWLPLRLVFGAFKPGKIILGGYLSGEVEAVGKDVSNFNTGDHVFGSAGLRLGAYGEYVCLPEASSIVRKPVNATFEQAAAVPLGGLNALHFLTKANIRPGEKVLINGAGGSIGTFGVQIAKALGAQVSAVDSGIKEQMLRRIGADHFIDYKEQNFAEGGQTYDVVFSMVAGTSYADCLGVLNPGGRYLLANPRMTDMLKSFFTNKFTNKTVIFAFAGETKEELLELARMIEDGRVSAVVDKIYPMDQIVEAHRRVETEQRLGTIVVSIANPP